MSTAVRAALADTRSQARILSLARESGALVAPSATLFAGTAAARFLGLLFSVAAARLLVPDDFADLVYGLTVVTFAAILLQNTPGGLGRLCGPGPVGLSTSIPGMAGEVLWIVVGCSRT